MKIIRTLVIVTTLLVSSAASAAWNPTTIKFVQMPITGNVVYVYFDTSISLDSCANPNTVNGAILRLGAENFDTMYARLLIAEQNNEQIYVLSSAGVCTAGVWADNPYIRFGN